MYVLVVTVEVTCASGSRSVATNSISGATPTVPKSRRLIELKKVLVNSASGRSATRSAKSARILVQRPRPSA